MRLEYSTTGARKQEGLWLQGLSIRFSLSGLGKSGGLTPPQPTQGSLEKGKRKEGKGLVVPGKTKSEEVEVVTRSVEDTGRRTHPHRADVPRTATKGVSNGMILTLCHAAVVGVLVLRTRPFPNISTHVIKSQ
jgi:hypothetical protein